MVKNIHRSSHEVPLFCATLMKLEFSHHIFGKTPEHPILRKSVPWESSCSKRIQVVTYRQTGMTQLITLLAILQMCQKQALSVSVYPFHYAIWPLEIPLKTLYSLTL